MNENGDNGDAVADEQAAEPGAPVADKVPGPDATQTDKDAAPDSVQAAAEPASADAAGAGAADAIVSDATPGEGDDAPDPESGDGWAGDGPPSDGSLLVGRLIGVIVFVFLLGAVIWPFRSTSVATGTAAARTSTTVQLGPMKVFGALTPPAAPVRAPAPDALMSTAIATFYNSGTTPVTVTGFEPVGATNLDVVGVKFAFDGPGFTPYIGKPGFPDPTSIKPGGSIMEIEQVNPVAPQNGLLTAKPPDNTVIWLIAGLRLAAGANEGSLTGIALLYQDETGPQRLVIDMPMTLCTGDDCS